MEKVLKEIIAKQKGFLTIPEILGYSYLVNVGFENACNEINKSKRDNSLPLLAVLNIIRYGTIDRRLTEYQLNKLLSFSNDSTYVTYLYELMPLFRECSDKIKPYLNNHPLVQEESMIEGMIPIAEKQNEALEKFYTSLPTSKFMYIPRTDKMRCLLCNAKNIMTEYKRIANQALLQDTVFPVIYECLKEEDYQGILKILYGYLRSIIEAKANYFPPIREAHNNCVNNSFLISSSDSKDEYLSASEEMEKECQKYDAVLSKVKKYDNLSSSSYTIIY